MDENIWDRKPQWKVDENSAIYLVTNQYIYFYPRIYPQSLHGRACGALERAYMQRAPRSRSVAIGGVLYAGLLEKRHTSALCCACAVHSSTHRRVPVLLSGSELTFVQ